MVSTNQGGGPHHNIVCNLFSAIRKKKHTSTLTSTMPLIFSSEKLLKKQEESESLPALGQSKNNCWGTALTYGFGCGRRDAIIAQHGEPEKWQKVRVSESKSIKATLPKVRLVGRRGGRGSWQRRPKEEGEPSQQHTAWVAS